MDTQNPSVFSSISPQAFNVRMGRADAPLMLDVRRQARFDESPRLLACAQRCAPEDVAALAASRPACPWLIRRFIDARAEFFYVPTHQVLAQAKELGAVACDIPGALVSHVGELCSFDALLLGFDLHDAALALLATIVRGADTGRMDLAPQSAGLLALALGLSRSHAADDHAMLEAAMPLYDALYAWCRDRVAAQDETHNWKPHTMAGATA